MSGDTKTRRRMKGDTGPDDPHVASRQVLQNALLKDYLASKQSLAAAEKETTAPRLPELQEANAARLEALLDAARQQEVEKSDPDSQPPADARRREPELKRLPAAPPRPPEVFLGKNEMRPAGERTRAEVEFSAAVDVEEPPSGAAAVSFPRLAIRAGLVAIVVGACAYAVLAPHWTEDGGAEQANIPEALVTAPDPGSADAAIPAAEAAAEQVSAPENPPPAMTATVTEPTPETEPVLSAPPAAAAAPAMPETPAQLPVEAKIQPPAKVPDAPRNAPVPSETASAAERVQPPAPPPVKPPVGQNSDKSPVTVDGGSTKASIPPPPPPAAPVASTPPVVPGENAGTPAPEAERAAPAKSVALDKRAPEKQPYFQRLGPYPPSNPFRPTYNVPAPPPPSYDFFEFYGEIE